MSNPIADTADYFKRWKTISHRAQTDDSDLHYQPQHSDSFDSIDPRVASKTKKGQWKGVIDRLLNTTMDSNVTTEEPEDMVSDDDSNAFIRARDIKQSTEEELQHQEDYNLPSAYDLENDNINPLDEEHSNLPEQRTYFKHPFAEQQEVADDSGVGLGAAPTAPPTLGVPEAAPVSSGETTTARNNWGKTVDLLKLMANLQQTSPDLQREGPTHTLATYYPPAFDPIFTAFARDLNGRKLPPILLQCIYVKITDSEYLENSNQWVVRVELMYGDIKWVIRRSISEFMTLHYKLKLKSNLYNDVPAPPVFPYQLSHLLATCKDKIGLYDEKYERATDSQQKELKERRESLADYLRKLLLRAHMMVSEEICEFLELSAISIVKDMGWKGKEGYLLNRMNHVSSNCCHNWTTPLWNTQWIILRDSYMAFCDDTASFEPTDVLLFDNGFSIETKYPQYYLGDHHIIITTESRRIEIKGTRREVDDFQEDISKVANESPWVQKHRFGSFAPVRHNAKLKWFVDAENHFDAVAGAILSAKSEIYIEDWWLTPELYLRRPPEENEEFRLDRLLKRKAEEGVKIYIVVYKEMSQVLTIDSAHTKKHLQGLHKNILVQRHPDHILTSENNVLFWSHHEKIVVVDNRLAFIGGLDLCLGRFDTHAHSLSDHPAEGHDKEVFPGQDYSNPRVKDFNNVAEFDKSLVSKTNTARMPWHDVSLGAVGPIARDIARHFIQRWNFLKSSKSMHRSQLPFLMPKGEFVADRDESNFEGSCKVQILRSSSKWSSDIEREHSIYNAYIECIAYSKHFIYIENQFFISATTQDDKVLRNKIAQALVERIRRAHENGEKYRVYITIPLIPAFEGDLAASESSSARSVMHFQYISISRGGNSIMEQLREYGIDPDQYINWFSLRNHGEINVQDNQDERQKFVSELLYIHDKLMIVDDKIAIMGSANINDRSMAGNRDSEIAMIIEDTETIPSYMNGKEYKAAKFAHTLRMQLWKEHLGLLNYDKWEHLLDDEEKAGDNEVDDLDVARNRQDHSYPLMTRSINNSKDIQDIETDEPAKMLDRVSRSMSVFDRYRKYHKYNTKRHDAAALDPLSERFYENIWLKTANTNTEIYRRLFRCVPDDTVHTYEQHHQFVPANDTTDYGHIADPDLDLEQIETQLNRIKGHLVKFPVDYLKDENLVGGNILETVTPLIIYT